MKLIVSLLLLCHLQGYSQSSLQRLEIGDKMPAGLLEEYKGKLIILDFWSVTCIPCIKALPKMDSLQKEFEDKLQILLITKNDSASVASLFKNIKQAKPDLPSLVADSIYSTLFPYNSVPHHVWIDSTGRVLYITEGYNTDSRSITDALEGKKLDVSYRKHFSDFDRRASLLKEGNGRLIPYLRYYSIFFNRIAEYGGGSAQYTRDEIENEVSGLKFTNMPMISLYKYAFEETFTPIEFNNDNRIMLEVKDKYRFIWPSDKAELDNWQSENVFCYESKFPVTNKNDVFIKLKQDLHFYFPFTAKIENRKTKCLALVKTSPTDKIKTKGGKALYKDSQEEGLYVRNQPIKNTLLYALKVQNFYLSTPIVDDTKYSENIDIDIKSKLTDIVEVRKELRKYNLDLIEKEVIIPMLVIKDKKQN